MRVNNNANTTGSDGTIDDTSTLSQSFQEASTSAAKEKAALINQLDAVATAVDTLKNSSGNEDGTVSTNSNSSIAENTNTTSEEESSSQTPSIGIEPYGTSQVQFSFGSKTVIFDLVPFKAFVDLMQQRLIQTETNLDLSKTMSASYIGLTTDADGKITGYNPNSDLTKMMMTAIVSQGDYQAQQTIINGTKDMASGLSQIAGAGITEAIAGTPDVEEQKVNKIQNAIDSIDKVKQLSTKVSDDPDNQDDSKAASPETEAIQKLTQANGLNFTKNGSHFGSKEEPLNAVNSKVKKYTLEDKVGDEIKVPGTQITVKNAIANAKTEQIQEIRDDWNAQLKQANEVLNTKRQNLTGLRSKYQAAVQAASSAIGGAVSLANAAYQQQAATQQAIQTAGQSATNTAQDLISTTKQTATASQQSIAEAEKELENILQSINQRRG